MIPPGRSEMQKEMKSNENGKQVDKYVDKYEQMLDDQNNNKISLSVKIMRIKMHKNGAI